MIDSKSERGSAGVLAYFREPPSPQTFLLRLVADWSTGATFRLSRQTARNCRTFVIKHAIDLAGRSHQDSMRTFARSARPVPATKLQFIDADVCA